MEGEQVQVIRVARVWYVVKVPVGIRITQDVLEGSIPYTCFVEACSVATNMVQEYGGKWDLKAL